MALLNQLRRDLEVSESGAWIDTSELKDRDIGLPDYALKVKGFNPDFEALRVKKRKNLVSSFTRETDVPEYAWARLSAELLEPFIIDVKDLKAEADKPDLTRAEFMTLLKEVDCNQLRNDAWSAIAYVTNKKMVERDTIKKNSSKSSNSDSSSKSHPVS